MHTKSIASGGHKGRKWTVTPRGPHKKNESKPLLSILRDLKYADNAREARKIIASGYVLVDGKKCRNPVLGLGLMDSFSIPKVKKSYRIVPVKHGLVPKEVPEKDTKNKLCKVIGKTVMSGNKIQLNLHDGTNFISDKKVKVGDTVILEMPERKIKEILPYEKGATAVVVSGRHRGESGAIKDVTPGTEARASLTTIGDKQTLTKYVFIIGKDKAQVEL